jgi:hypothetical protein
MSFPNEQNRAAAAIPVWIAGAGGIGYAAIGYEQITSLGSATGLTVPANAIYAILQAEAQVLRYRDDGTDPTASVGMMLYPGGSFTYNADLTAIKFIQADSGGILNVLYYGVAGLP